MNNQTPSLPSERMSPPPSAKDAIPIPSWFAAEVNRFYQEDVPAEFLCPPAASPERPRDIGHGIDLAYEEYCQRWERGEAFDAEEFCRRHPAFRSSLRKLVFTHHLIDEKARALAENSGRFWPEPGTSFLHFHLLHRLGRGSFSRVFVATEPALGHRLVVVKISTRGTCEAETLGRLTHPHIVPVYSVSHDAASRLTLVCMPYQGNATLGHVLDRALDRPGLPDRAQIILEAARQGMVPGDAGTPKQAPEFFAGQGTYVDGIVSIAVPLAEALAFIHSRGVYHRDLKPSNVLLTPQGKPMLLDFNLSQDARSGNLQMGGTVPYMSPEQLRATAPDTVLNWTGLDARSDLFSLGVILYEMLTGRHPFGPIGLKQPEAELYRQLLERQCRGPIPLRSVNPQVPRTLARVIERCLAFDPARRFQQAGDLAAALRKHLPRPQRVGRRRASFLAAGLVAVAVLAASYFALREPEAHRLFNQGRVAYQHGQYQEALARFTDVLKAEPNQVEALFARGRVHQKMGNLTLALTDYQSASNLSPDGRFSACIGYCKGLNGDFVHAINDYAKAIAQGFAPAEVYNNLGFGFLRLNQYSEAVLNLNKAIARNNKLQAAYYNRARVYINKAFREQSNYLKAQFVRKGIDDIERAMLLGPNTADLCLLAVSLYSLKGKYDGDAMPTALDYAATALDLGLDPRKLQDEAERHTPLAVLRDHPRFKNLLLAQYPLKNPSQQAPHLLDPIRDATLE